MTICLNDALIKEGLASLHKFQLALTIQVARMV